MLRETPIANLWGLFVMLSVGWMPGYLVFNATGPVKYRGKNANHFSPSAVFFKPDEYWLIVQTDIAFFACVGLLGYAIYTFGKRNNLKMMVLVRSVTSACCLRVLDCVFLLFDSFHDHQSVLGAHHIPATHRCFHAAFPQQGMVRKHDRSACYLFLGACMKQCCMYVCAQELAPRGAVHCGPIIRLAAEPHPPPHHRHPCLPPPVFEDALLSRSGNERTTVHTTCRAMYC